MTEMQRMPLEVAKAQMLLSKKLNVSLDELMETDFAAQKENKADRTALSSEEQ